MKTWKLELLAAAMSLAMATAAGAQSTNSKTMPADATTPPGSTMRSDTPKECVNLTGRAMSDCVRDHNPSSMNSKSGTNGSMGNADADSRPGTKGAIRNDKSGSGTGSTGSSAGAAAGASGQTGAAGTGTGAAGAGSSGTGGAAGGGTSGDTGGAGAGAGGGGGK